VEYRADKLEQIWNILTSILGTGLIAAIYHYLYGRKKELPSLMPKEDLLSGIEARIENLERRQRSLHGYVSRVGRKKRSTPTSTGFTREEQEFIDGLSPMERNSVMAKLNSEEVIDDDADFE